MKYDDICSVVAQRAATDRPHADRVAKAALQALAEQIDPAVLDQVLAQLPPEFAKTPEAPDRQEHRNLDGYLTRVATLADIPVGQARRTVLAVFAALAATMSADALESAVTPLGEDFTALLPPPDELLDADTFLDTVRERAGVETRTDAEAATSATLHALGERLTDGQATDLAAYLPPSLRPQLDSPHPEAQAFDYADFLRRIADERDSAEAYARAVLATVREAAPEPEIQDTLAQLPNDLARLFT